ncbi:MAG TPA: EamA family transporter RarD [Frankiaceae bacterium]
MPRTGRIGILLGTGAYVLWGLFPLYFPLLEPTGALEILAYRVVFSLVTILILVAARHRLGRLRRLSRPAVVRLSVAGVVIAVNWGSYIWGVNHHHVVETSLGYFINPLVTVLLGVVVLRERLRTVQWAALGVGAAAVVVITVDYGRPPWLALLLALSFGTYGLMKKQVGVEPDEGLVVETAVLVLPALVTIAVVTAGGHGTFVGSGAGHAALLVLVGFVTVVPLLLFAGAASRLPLSTLGLLQYLAPVLQLLFGVTVRGESLGGAQLIGFGLVWVALLVLTVDGLRGRGRTARRAAGPATDPTDVPLALAEHPGA